MIAGFVKVCAVSELPAGEGRAVPVGDGVAAVFNVDGRFYAIDNRCAHRDGPLADGVLDGTTVYCPLHAWDWDVTTGVSGFDPSIKLACFEVRVEGNDLWVGPTSA